jgi:hypothetical protein
MRNAKSLALRDPALAALLGAASADFGEDANGYDDADIGVDFGVDFGADAPLATSAAPSTQQLHAMWQQMHAQRRLSSERERLLEPNKGSATKVERYSFALNTTLTLSTASAINLTGNPDTNIRPQRVTMNAPAPGFVSISQIKVANVSVLVGGIDDAFNYNANGVGQHLDMPTLTPANRASISGDYSGLLPAGGYVTATPFIFVVGLKGPASIVA